MQKITSVLGYALFAYVMFFIIWVLLIGACVTDGNVCGDDLMTKAVRVLYPYLWN